jgi:hypothetical protein
MNKIATLGVLVAVVVLLGTGTAVTQPADSSLAAASETPPVVIDEPGGEAAPIDLTVADAGVTGEDPAFVLNSPFAEDVPRTGAADSGGDGATFLL